MPDRISPPTTAAAAVPYIYPLDDFYARSGLLLPKIERLTGEQVPEPYRKLLVHENDMTPTLEQFHGRDIHLRILSSVRRDDFYFRQVVLQLDQTDQPVEFGANKVNLTLFPPKARQLILEERVPLGRILKDFSIEHTTHAKAFFQVEADALIAEALRLTEFPLLYGRRATISDPQKRPLSEIVEILPPVKGKHDA